MKTVGLFAGVGGFELGLGRAGHSTELLCEIEPGAQAVLRAKFPKVKLHDDVTTLRELPRGTELLVGGFPCQDLSQAGKTAGIEGARSGLVGEVFRLLEQHDVPWVVLENVPFMLQLSRGRAMDVIVEAIEHLKYKWAYRVIDSRSFGVPQRRERVYMVATRDGDPRDVLFAHDAGEPAPVAVSWSRANGFYWTEGIRGLGWADDAVPTLKGGSTLGIPSPPAIVMPNRSIVTPHLRDAERMQGFDAGWTEASETVMKRGHRWKLVGNAVTVDAAEWLGQRLRAPDQAGRNVPSAPLVRAGAWPRAAFNVGEGRRSVEISAWPERSELMPAVQRSDRDGNPAPRPIIFYELPGIGSTFLACWNWSSSRRARNSLPSALFGSATTRRVRKVRGISSSWRKLHWDASVEAITSAHTMLRMC